nr:MAG: hypothetical protein E4H34_01175 [Hyphomicrobiales bacterium]
MPRLLKLSLALFAICISFPAAAQNWVEYADREELFSVNFPHAPIVEKITHHSEYHAELPAKVYAASDGQVSYKVTVVNYAGAQVVDVRGSIAFAAWNFRRRGGEITFDAYAQVDRIEGHQLQFTNADLGRTYVAVHLHKSRLYILEATAPAGVPPPGHFQQSLSILDENGDRVRYDLDADGVRTRVD